MVGAILFKCYLRYLIAWKLSAILSVVKGRKVL
jgi:hypothetical protein